MADNSISGQYRANCRDRAPQNDSYLLKDSYNGESLTASNVGGTAEPSKVRNETIFDTC